MSYYDQVLRVDMLTVYGIKQCDTCRKALKWLASPDATPTTLPPVDRDAPIDELLAEIETLMIDLDERIIDRRGHTAQLDRLQDVWRVAEQQIRADNPDDVYNFQQAIDLAESGVERVRPADASKGYKIIADVIDHYLAQA